MDWPGTVTTYYHDLSVTKLFPLIIVCVNLLLSVIYPGADPGFQVRGGAHRKIAPSGGRRENIWGISCEKSRFYAKKKYHIFPNFRGGARRVRPPPSLDPSLLSTGYWNYSYNMVLSCFSCVSGLFLFVGFLFELTKGSDPCISLKLFCPPGCASVTPNGCKCDCKHHFDPSHPGETLTGQNGGGNPSRPQVCKLSYVLLSDMYM